MPDYISILYILYLFKTSKFFRAHTPTFKLANSSFFFFFFYSRVVRANFVDPLALFPSFRMEISYPAKTWHFSNLPFLGGGGARRIAVSVSAHQNPTKGARSKPLSYGIAWILLNKGCPVLETGNLFFPFPFELFVMKTLFSFVGIEGIRSA